ncbi:MAG: hypothetical protein ABUT39_27705 [Acidobacteriota bacterium]
MRKKNAELDRLLAKVQALRPETRDGIIRFLQLVMALEKEPGRPAPASEPGEPSVEDLRELRRIFEMCLQAGPSARRDLFFEVCECAQRAQELAQEEGARLLVQTGILIAAGEEQLGSFLLQGATCAAALDIVRAATRSVLIDKATGS